MAGPDGRVPDQQSMWDAWHARHEAVDDADLHSACREGLIAALPPPGRSGAVLELGCGQGFDAIAIAEHGYDVVAMDFSAVGLAAAQLNLSKLDIPGNVRVNFMRHDIALPLPYPDSAFSGVYSYLALHYFDVRTTRLIFDEIARVAEQSCIFSFAVRSTQDPLFGKGYRISEKLYNCKGHVRHFFDPEELHGLLSLEWAIQELREVRSYYLSRDTAEGGIIKALAVRK
jgi:SAM-dependent methyltransferase